MAFFSKNSMVVMDLNPMMASIGNLPLIPIKIDDLKRIKDAGVNYCTQYCRWDAIERQMGQYNWAATDVLVDRVSQSGMKCILFGYHVPLQCAPTDWYSRIQSGQPIGEVLSYWNEEAQAYARNFYYKLVDRYGSDTCLVAMSEYLSGECCLHNIPSFYDQAALQDYAKTYRGVPDINNENTKKWLQDAVVKHYLDTQEVLVPQHNEIWEELQWLIATQSLANGNFAQPEVQKACLERWPDVNYVLLQYTYFMHGEPYFAYIRNLIKNKINLIVEAQYVTGLKNGTTPIAIQHGASGQIVAPLHPFTGQRELEPWMYEVIEKAATEFRNSAAA
jgi:hypothetical protein